MKEKARDFIYLNHGNYHSLDNLRCFYLVFFGVAVLMSVISSVKIHFEGVSWKSLFPIVSIAIWGVLYSIFFQTIQSPKTKKTFELRFLVNGIWGVFSSALFWLAFASFVLAADEPFVGFDFLLWVLFFYLLFSVIYIWLLVRGVHKGAYKKNNKKEIQNRSAVNAAIIPCVGTLGAYISRVIRGHASMDLQVILAITLVILFIFFFALLHINFVQYYYCKKYGINCDENGDRTSPALERNAR